MRRDILLPAAFLLDRIAGDPEWLPHPVRLMGKAIAQGEAALRSPGQSPAVELVCGTALSVGLVTTTYGITAFAIARAHRCSPLLGAMTEVVLGWTCLAGRNLEQEACSVVNALTAGDEALARARLARIVGRDTHALDESEISRAVIEAVAESACDGIVAPLFYMAVGGVPLAMAYKSVNTLDSMIGHADARYFYFGKFAARLDDAANLVPARLTAVGIVAASLLRRHPDADAHAAWRTWQRDGSKHKSPNAGRPESAMAGALHVQLGGDNTYAGELIPAQRLAPEFPAATPTRAKEAIRLVATVSLLAVAAAALVSATFAAVRRSR